MIVARHSPMVRVSAETSTLSRPTARPCMYLDNVLGWSIGSEVFDERDAVDVVLAPGDVSIRHPNVIHGANANISLRWRCGLMLGYIPTTTCLTEGDPFPTACLLRRDAVPGMNTYNPLLRYVASKHMPFGDQAAGNARADQPAMAEG